MSDYIIVSLILQERNDIIRQNFTLLEEIGLAAFDAGILIAKTFWFIWNQFLGNQKIRSTNIIMICSYFSVI